uniref:Uncharacterized protein n=1 Tax=Oryza brachyantha TaxID=4533 RepID=J3MDE4_ORYBR
AVPVATGCAQPSQHFPAGPAGVGPHEAKQIQHHGHPQREHGDPYPRLLVHDGEDEDEDDDHNGQGECRRVAVEEDEVPGVVGIPDDGVTGEVPGLSILPDTPRRVEPCRICHCGHHDCQQQEVLPQAILQWSVSSIFGFLIFIGHFLAGDRAVKGRSELPQGVS